MKLNPYFEVLLATLIWGSSGTFVKYINIPASTLAFFRMAVPTVILLLFLKKIKFDKTMILASVLNAIRMFLYLAAFTYTTIGNAVIILYTWPVFVAILAVIFLKEKISKKMIFSIFAALIGIFLVYLGNGFSFKDKDFIGISLMLVSAIIYSFTVIIFKKESKKYSNFETVFYQNVAGAVIFVPFIFLNDFPSLNQTILSVIYATLIGLAGFGLFYSSLRRIDASKASLFCYSEIFFAIIFAMIFFSESLTWNMIAGALMIVLSSLLAKGNV